MTKKQETQKQSLATVARKANFEQVLHALKTVDIENYKKGVSTFKAKEFLEVKLYTLFIDNNEEEEREISITLENVKTLQVLATTCPYITGIKNFAINYEKKQGEQKEKIVLTCKVKTPYGDYRNGLEINGLIFATKDKSKEQALSNEQQDAIQEANNLLQSVGLTGFQY